MALAKDLNKYGETFWELFSYIRTQSEPVEIAFPSNKDAMRFRFKCYGFKNAMERAVNKQTKEEREADMFGYKEYMFTLKSTVIKLEGKKLRFVRGIDDVNEVEKGVAAFLAKAKAEEKVEEMVEDEGTWDERENAEGHAILDDLLGR